VVVWDSQLDLAIVRLQTSSGAPFIPPDRRPVTFASQEARLGDPVRILGYPVVREDQFEVGERYTLTLTDGAVSGTENFGERSRYNPSDSRRYTYEVWGEYIKHTASQNGGVSGGGAFNTRGELVAVPTAGDDKLELMRSIRFAKVLIAQVDK
jgi:S1-C subfamily serine protease